MGPFTRFVPLLQSNGVKDGIQLGLVLAQFTELGAAKSYSLDDFALGEVVQRSDGVRALD